MAAMDVEQALLENLQQPVVENENVPILDQQKRPKTPTQKVVRKTFKGIGRLARLLPTGSVLAFQGLSPILTHQGKCNTKTSQYLTIGLLGICSLSSCLICFTDSLRDERGKVRYGLATFDGLWVIDDRFLGLKLNEEEKQKYKIRFMDFLHALLSLFIFWAICLFDKNVVSCFLPTPTMEEKDLLRTVPIGVGLVCFILFLLFPTKRHGISSPLSKE